MDVVSDPGKQNGAVIIVVLMTVAIIALVSADMAYKQKLDIQRTNTILSQDQAFQYALSMESLGKLALVEDLRDDKKNDKFKDDLKEDWAVSAKPFHVPGGVLVGKMIDLQGRFNINSLVNGNQSESKSAQEVLKKLMFNLDLPDESDSNTDVSASGLIERVIDWIDEDDETTGIDGWEDKDYLSEDTPYRAANRLMIDTSELLLVKGFTRELLQELAPYITALPLDTPLNLNTAPEELLNALDGVDGAALVKAREEKDGGYEKVEDALEAGKGGGEGDEYDEYGGGGSSSSSSGSSGDDDYGEEGKASASINYSVHSQFFQLNAKAVVNKQTVYLVSQFYRPNKMVDSEKDDGDGDGDGDDDDDSKSKASEASSAEITGDDGPPVKVIMRKIQDPFSVQMLKAQK